MTNKIEQQITSFIKNRVGTRGALIGLSGGIDSALSCALAVEALGSDKVMALIVKNVRYPEEHLAIAQAYAKKLGIKTVVVETDAVRTVLLNELRPKPTSIEQVSSLDARLTDLLLRTTAQQHNLIYLGSINGTERLTGWYPKGSLFGDYCPIGGLLKSQVQALAHDMGLPDEIINTVSDDAGRICSGCGLLDEFVGIPYKQLDAVLLEFETTGTFSTTHAPRPIVNRIKNRVRAVYHKQAVFPPYPITNQSI